MSQDAPPNDSRPSKTAVKKAMHALQELGLALLELPPASLASLQLDERLAEALTELRDTHAHGARKRQMKYVGKLLREVDTGPLEEALATHRAGGMADRQRHHDIEGWRDRLVAGDEGLDAWIAQHPQCDDRGFRSLVRQARTEHEQAEAASLRGHPRRKGKASRELFRRLREILDAGA